MNRNSHPNIVSIENPVVNITALPARSPSLPMDFAIVNEDTAHGADIMTISDTNSTPRKPNSTANERPIAGCISSFVIVTMLRLRLSVLILLMLKDAPSIIIAIGVVHSDMV